VCACLLLFVPVRFGAFLGARGVQKQHKNMFTKIPCRKLVTKHLQQNPMLVPPCFFVSLRFWVFLSDEILKSQQKGLQKKCVEFSLQKH
jgi:hypothetical protein